ncbi:MAG: hypothetical protein V6Z82_04155 [Flavobacteriales bacterium]
MNRQNFKMPGGFPLETDTLDEMQKAYSLLNALGEVAGDKAIVQGCVEDGEHISDGVVYVDGEVFAFRGGPKRDTVIVKEEAVSKTFENGQAHEVLFKRYIAFGSGENNMNWREFKRYRLVEEVAEFKGEVNESLAGKAPLSHNHDDRYYTESETDIFFEGESSGKKQVNWNRVTGKPSAYPPITHNHDDRYYNKSESDSKYCSKSKIRDYGYLTDIVYETISYNSTKTASFYSDHRVCCFMQISDMPDLITTRPVFERYGLEERPYGARPYDTRIVQVEAEITGGFIIKMGFAKIKITQ